MKKSIIAFFLFAIVCVLSSCNKDNPATTSSLQATWKKTYNGYTVGVTFKSDNTFSFGIYTGSSYTETITGNWVSSTGNTVVFSNQSGSMESCPNTAATYNYAISGNNLVLTENTDPCSGRPAKISGTYTK